MRRFSLKPITDDHGFTLVELLVVIAIMALLMGILMPALSMARKQGQQAVCQSNLRQVGLAAALYADENEHLRRPDPNIDHRRVLNLQTFFSRNGIVLPVTADAEDYVAGDLVTWVVAGNLPHIGIVAQQRSPDGERPLIVHNIGRGPQLEDMLFSYPITGHYRYYGSR